MPHKSRIELLQSFLEEDPSDPFTLYALAIEHAALDHFRESHIYFEKLVNNKPDYLPAYYHLGKLYERQNNITEAGNTYMKGIRIAERQANNHTKKELQQAYNSLMNIDDSDL